MEWAITNRPLNTSRLLNEYSDTRILQDELVRRGIATFEAAEKFLHPDLYVETSPFDFPQMEAAVDRVNQAIKSGEKIGVWGDFDVDGQTSTALLVDALRKQGAKVHFHVPVRGPESHGISLPALKTFLTGGLDLI